MCYKAVSLPISHSPVTMWIRDPDAPEVEGRPPKMIEKTYDSYYVDARIARRGRIRAATIPEAHEKGLPIAEELAKEGEAAIKLSPEQRRIHVIAKKALDPFHLAVDEGARRLAEILTQLKGRSFEKVMQVFEAASQNLKLGVETGTIFDEYVHDQEEIRGNSAERTKQIGWPPSFPSTTGCNLDFGNVDLAHLHHCIEGALGFSATGRNGVRQRPRRDLPGNPPPVLAPTASALLATVADNRIPIRSVIFGYPDDLKLRWSMTLFAGVSPADSVFSRVLAQYFGGEPDQRTLEILQQQAST